MRLPIRKKSDQPLTIFIEPICDRFEVPVGEEAIVTLEDGHPHSIDWLDDAWLSIWNEEHQPAAVEIRPTHASISGG